jgi:hypothetical protein
MKVQQLMASPHVLQAYCLSTREHKECYVLPKQHQDCAGYRAPQY